MTNSDEQNQNVPIPEQIRFMQQELTFRERSLSHQLASGKISQCKADREIATLRSVLATLQGARS